MLVSAVQYVHSAVFFLRTALFENWGICLNPVVLKCQCVSGTRGFCCRLVSVVSDYFVAP